MSLVLLELLAGALMRVQDAPPEVPSDGVHVEVRAAAWYVLPSGWLSITRGSRAGTATTLRVGDEFDLEPEIEPSLEATFALNKRHALEVRAWTLGLSGTSTDEDGFVYHGETFAAGRAVRAEVDFLILDANYRYCFNPDDPFKVSGRLGAEYWKFDSRLKTVDGLLPIDTSRGFESAFWLAGVEVEYRASDSIALRGSLSGGTERSNQYFFEAEAGARMSVWGQLSATLGYRYHTLHFRQSTNESGLNFQGPLLGLQVDF